MHEKPLVDTLRALLARGDVGEQNAEARDCRDRGADTVGALHGIFTANVVGSGFEEAGDRVLVLCFCTCATWEPSTSVDVPSGALQSPPSVLREEVLPVQA